MTQLEEDITYHIEVKLENCFPIQFELLAEYFDVDVDVVLSCFYNLIMK